MITRNHADVQSNDVLNPYFSDLTEICNARHTEPILSGCCCKYRNADAVINYHSEREKAKKITTILII